LFFLPVTTITAVSGKPSKAKLSLGFLIGSDIGVLFMPETNLETE
jgi:hypothetical protein